MARTTREEQAIDLLGSCRDFLKKYWQVLIVSGACIGVFYEHKEAVSSLKATLARLREDHDALLSEYRDYHTVSADGFASPQVRLALDKYVAGILKLNNDAFRIEAKHYLSQLFQLNPGIVKPAE